MRKNLDPNLKPEKEHILPKQGSLKRPHVGQGRAGLKRKRPDCISYTINQQSNLSQKNLERTKIETRKRRTKNRNKKIKPCAFHRSNAFHKQHG